jgi:N-acyl homoserine lactone hydrolase
VNAVTAVGSVSVISTGSVRIHPERDHFQLPGVNWRQVSLEQTADPALAPVTETLDLMGDGSLMLLPTPGHTAGSVSLLVRRADRPTVLLTGDLTYGVELMGRGQLHGVGRRRQLAASTRKVLGLAERHPGLVVLPAHDPTAPGRLLESGPGGLRAPAASGAGRPRGRR